jgi:phospholipid transport system substrate-binding protein
MKNRLLVAFATAVVSLASPAVAGEPTDVLKARVDRILALLDQPGDQRAEIRHVADEIFDFEEMSRRALATHWRERTPEEQQKFVVLFADLLENTYFAQIDAYSGGGSVRYGPENVQGDQATVRTTIVTTRGTEIPLDYRLHQKDGRWWVYDVNIEGVSLVNNYRAQFNQIIRTSSYQQLVQRLEKKSIPPPKSPSAGS